MRRRLETGRAAAVGFLIGALAGVGVGAAEDWPRWRGPGFDGTAAGAGAFARPFRLEVRWRRAVGSGYSGVVVAGGRAVTLASDGEEDAVVALDADDGHELWRFPLGPTYPGRDGSVDGPVSTPAIDGGLVVALGPRGDLVALEAATGALRWRRRLAAELGAPTPHWGFGTSPLVAAGRVYVLTGASPERFLTAFDAGTGATLWSAGSDEATYASPMLIDRGSGETWLVAGGHRYLFAFDPASGRELWRAEHGGDGFYAKVINPVRVGAGALFVNHRQGGSALLPFPPAPDLAPRWSTSEIKLTYSTPVLLGGVLYGFSRAFLTAVDAASGAMLWRSRPPGGGFPLVVDGRLAVLTMAGSLHVAEVGVEGYRELASLSLFDRLVWTPPSFANGRFYARDSFAEVAAVDVVAIESPAVAGSPQAVRGTLPESAFARWVASAERAAEPVAEIDRFLAAQASIPIVESDRRLHFVYRGEATDLAVRGDFLATNEELPMRRVAGTDLFYASIELEPGARIQYQLVRNLSERIADPRNPDETTSLVFAGPVSVAYLPASRRADPPPEVAPERRGRIVDFPFATPELPVLPVRFGGEWKVKVYLPAGYDADSKRRYPLAVVLYGEEMLEGGALARRLDAAIGETAEPLVVVFLGVESGYEYARSHRELHRRMVIEELLPAVDAAFRTATEPGRRALAGVDEGGFAAVETVLRHPEALGVAAAVSTLPIGAGGRELLELVAQSDARPRRFYLDWGRYDQRIPSDGTDVAGFGRRLAAALRGRGFPVDGGELADGAALPFWGERLAAALARLFPAG